MASESDTVGALHKSAPVPFRTSPLVDLSNKIVFSPQSELVAKLQQTSLSSSNPLAKTNECDKLGASSIQKTVSWSVGSYVNSNSAITSAEIKRLSLGDGDQNDENQPQQIDVDLPEHFLALIKNVPNNAAISQLRRDRSKSLGGALKRVCAIDTQLGAFSSSQKKPKGPLEIIKESATSPIAIFEGRARSGSAPPPFDGALQQQQQKLTESLVTPTKPCDVPSVNEVGSITPIGIRARQKLPALRKLPISRSMVSLDLFPLNNPACPSSPSTSCEQMPPPKPGSASPHKLGFHSLEFRAIDTDTPLLIGDMSRTCLLSCRLCDGVPLVDCDEIAKLLEGVYSAEVERAYIIDCRFPYEYDGGHIRGAVNFPHPFYENLKTAFFGEKNCLSLQQKNAAWLRPPGDSCEKVASRVIIIFHCEFSSHRAPNTYRWFRTEDRNAHTIANYPKLDYPEAYILRGGYKAFVKYCHQSGKQHLCDPPGGYIKQVDSRYTEHLKRFQRRIKTMSEVDCPSLLNNRVANESIPSSMASSLHSPSHQRGEFFIGSPSSQNSISYDDVTQSGPQLTASCDSDDEVVMGSRDSSKKHEFDEFEDDMKVLHVSKREMYRRRSDCPMGGLYTALGRASFEELAAAK